MEYSRNQKFALVLAGGGAKGIYQIGAWKAFRELDIQIEAVAGTSVGALNGALIIQNEFERIVDLWMGLTLDKIVEVPSKLIKNGKLHFMPDLIPELMQWNKDIIQNKGLSTQPLKKIIDKHIVEDKIRRSGIDFGLVTFDLTKLKPLEIYLESIPANSLGDYLLASASLPMFRSAQIEGKPFADGGLANNIPYNLIKDRGYRNIIIVDVSGIGVIKKYNPMGTCTVTIKNSLDIGTILSFEPNILEQLYILGYLDTLRTFSVYDGWDYFYKPDPLLYRNLIDCCEKKEVRAAVEDFQELKPDQTVTQALRNVLPGSKKVCRHPWNAAMECAALCLDIKKLRPYMYSELLALIYEKYCYNENQQRKDESHYKSFFEQLTQQIKRIDFSKSFLQYSAYEYLKALHFFPGKKIKKVYYGLLTTIFPELVSAQFFLAALNCCYKAKKFDSV